MKTQANDKTCAYRSSYYPFQSMGIGESFYTPNVYARRSAYGFARRHGLRFMTRREGNGLRIWRVA